MRLREREVLATATPAVAKELGVSFRQLDYWWRNRLISGTYSSGSGYPRVWSPEQVRDAEELSVAARISGVTGKSTRPDYRILVTLVRNLRALGLDPLELAGIRAGTSTSMSSAVVKDPEKAKGPAEARPLLPRLQDAVMPSGTEAHR